MWIFLTLQLCFSLLLSEILLVVLPIGFDAVFGGYL